MSDLSDKIYEEESDIQVEAEEKPWSFSGVWNKALEQQEERPLKVRNHLWASELGKAPIDLYLKLTGVKPTNPPNARSLRKFEAGNIFEWIVSLILKRAGILQESQKWTSFQYPGLLQTTGKADFIVGGVPKGAEEAINEMKALGLPDVFIRGAEAVASHLMTFTNGLKPIPLEIKSVSSFMFEALEARGVASKNHRLQLFHYLKSTDYDQGRIVYISRDDLRMMEVVIEKDSPVEQEYKQAIETVSKYIIGKEKPPLEQPITFDEDLCKFSKNFNVAYSNYLTMLYGFKDQKEFDDKYVSMVSSWNRVVGRLKEGKIITEKNKLVLEQIKEAGFSVEDILKKFFAEPDLDE